MTRSGETNTPSHADRSASTGRVGLIAGWGRYPLLIARALRRQGREIYCLGVPGHADPKLADLCRDFRYCGVAKFGRACRYFRRHGVTQATMAGKFHKRIIFQPWFLLRQMPDLHTIRWFMPHFFTFRKDRRDDTLLGAAVELFAAGGVHFRPATDFAPELLVRQGQLTRRGPSPVQWRDIEFGWMLAKEMGRLDVGQSVAVKGQAVLAVEAVEGTDPCILRAGRLCPAGGFTVVKVAKPQQDMRFDVPTIGLETLRTMVEAGARILAVEADRTILLDEQEVIDFANRNKLVIVARQDQQQAAHPLGPPHQRSPRVC